MTACVYTAVIGGYDGLLDQPIAETSDCEFICFTDDADLQSDCWDIRLVEPAFREDPVRSARLLKILGHESLRAFDSTLYIDASVSLRRTPEAILAEWLSGDVEFALAAHSYRATLLDEFDEVIRLNYDDRARLYEQLTHYALAHPDVLSSRPLWTGMMARRRSVAMEAAMRTWANHVLRYSRRDQLSVLVALTGDAPRYRVLEMDNYSAPSHEWPVIPARKVEQGKASAVPIGPMVADIRRLNLRTNELERELATLRAIANRDQIQAEADRILAENDAAQSSERIDALTTDLAQEKRAREAADQRLSELYGVRGATRHLRRQVASRFHR